MFSLRTLAPECVRRKEVVLVFVAALLLVILALSRLNVAVDVGGIQVNVSQPASADRP